MTVRWHCGCVRCCSTFAGDVPLVCGVTLVLGVAGGSYHPFAYHEVYSAITCRGNPNRQIPGGPSGVLTSMWTACQGTLENELAGPTNLKIQLDVLTYERTGEVKLVETPGMVFYRDLNPTNPSAAFETFQTLSSAGNGIGPGKPNNFYETGHETAFNQVRWPCSRGLALACPTRYTDLVLLGTAVHHAVCHPTIK